MGDISLTAANVRALQANGAVVRSYDAGAAITVGEAVYIASDGDVEPTDADLTEAAAKGIGIAVESYDGETSIASGDPVGVCVFGPVSGFSGMTPGQTLYTSDEEGNIADAAGTASHVIGHAESATIVWVDPDQSDPSSS
jgi:hypothetical protein